MKRLFLAAITPTDRIQYRLLLCAVLFLFLFSVCLSIAPAVRLNSWNVSYEWVHWIGFALWLVGISYLHYYTCRKLPDRDPYILSIAAILSGWGLLTIWRLSTFYGIRQTIWLALAFLVYRLVIGFPRLLSILMRYKYIWLFSGLVITGLTLIFGTYPGGRGPHLWLGCCGIYFEPSEILKPLLVIYLASYLAGQMPFSFSMLRLLIPTFILMSISFLLLIVQHDLDTAFLLIGIYAIVIYLASGKWRILLICATVFIIASISGYFLVGVIRLRIDAWLNPWQDPSGRSYQIVQSLIAVAAGGVFGRGPGLGNPEFVPVSSSDFIFVSIAEETGLVGTIGILVILAILAVRCLKIASSAANRYQRFLSAGLVTSLILQSLLIIGGNIRLLPLTGITLPLMSYGGSSLLTSFFSLAILATISNQPERETQQATNKKPFFWIGSAFLLCVFALALINGWWGFIRAPGLLSRSDNPRSAIIQSTPSKQP